MFPSVSLSPWDTNLETQETVGVHFLGGLYYDRGELYMFVINGSADTDAIKGYLAGPMAGGPGYVTMKDGELIDGTLTNITRALGMWCYAVEFGNYGFLKVVGWSKDENDDELLVTAGGVAAGDPLVLAGAPGSVTFIAEKAAAGEEHGVIGHAIAADVGTAVMATLNCLP